MALSTRPLAFSASALGLFAIGFALVLLTAGPDTATSSIRMLTVDTTSVGAQVKDWFVTGMRLADVRHENVGVFFPPGAVHVVHYRDETRPGRLTGATNLASDILSQTLPPATYNGFTWKTSYAVFSVKNGTDSALVTAPFSKALSEAQSCFETVQDSMDAWNSSSDASFDPSPAAGLLITASLLQAGSVVLMVMIGVGVVVVKLEYNRNTRVALASPSLLAALFSLASAAHITRIIRALEPNFQIKTAYMSPAMALVPHTTSPVFWALTWLNAICAMAVAGIAVRLVRPLKATIHGKQAKLVDA